MVKIIFGEHSQQADLAGKSVAEARELYRSEFGIPDRAQASLNDTQLKKKLEPETKLGDEDKLAFEEKSRRGLVLLGAFLLVLAVTSGLFAYTALTDTAVIDVTAVQTDFGDVTTNTTGQAETAYTFLGKIRDKIPAGTLFNVTQDANFTGDVEVLAHLANADELSQDYTFWMLRLELVSSDNTSKQDIDTSTQVLSLDSPVVSFGCDNLTGNTYFVRCQGGSYRARGHGHGAFGEYDPLIFCEILQSGPQP